MAIDNLTLSEVRALSPEARALRREAALKEKYGLTAAALSQKLRDQGGACAVCASAIHEGGAKRAYKVNVDHCHATGRVRGLLCHHCNAGLGHFKDNTAALMSAIKYLGAHRD